MHRGIVLTAWPPIEFLVTTIQLFLTFAPDSMTEHLFLEYMVISTFIRTANSGEGSTVGDLATFKNLIEVVTFSNTMQNLKNGFRSNAMFVAPHGIKGMLGQS